MKQTHSATRSARSRSKLACFLFWRRKKLCRTLIGAKHHEIAKTCRTQLIPVVVCNICDYLGCWFFHGLASAMLAWAHKGMPGAKLFQQVEDMVVARAACGNPPNMKGGQVKRDGRFSQRTSSCECKSEDRRSWRTSLSRRAKQCR